MKHVGPISGVAVCGSLVATAGYDNQLILWDLKSGRSLARSFHDHLINSCQFSPDGLFIISASSDCSTRVWSVPGLRLTTILSGHEDDVMRAAYSPNGEMIASCSYDASLIIYDSAGMKAHRLRGHSGLIEDFCWADHGELLFSTGVDGTVRTWEARTGKCIDVLDTGGADVDAIASLSGSGFVYGNDQGFLVFRTQEGCSEVRAHSSGVKTLQINDQRDKLLSVGYDGVSSVWSLADTSCVTRLHSSHYPDVVWARSAAFLGNDRVVFGSFGSKHVTWKFKENTWDCVGIEPTRGINSLILYKDEFCSIGDAGLVRHGILRGEGPGSLCNFLATDGEIILTGGQNGKLFMIGHSEPILEHSSPLNCGLHVIRDTSSLFVVGSYSGDLLVFERVDQEVHYRQTVKLHENAIKGICARDDKIVSGSADGELKFSSLEDFSTVSSVRNAHDGILNGICSCVDGVATVSRDKTLRLWKGNSPEIYPSRHPNSIKAVASNESGTIVATGSYGGTVDLFDCEKKLWIGQIRRPTASGISSLVWADTLGTFLAGSYDGEVYEITCH